MNYIENIYVCLAAPLILAILCLRKNGRRLLIFLLAGMTACLLSAYVSTYLTGVTGIDSTAASHEISPVVEEVMFRLGLSFKRQTVALWAGLLPLVSAYYLCRCRAWYILLGIAAVGAVLYWLICRFTSDEQWKSWRTKYIIPAMWISAIGFGLMHLRAFSVLNGQVFPFALTTILIPMAGGCAITYARVNLGFWWGVLLHCLINLPGVILIATSIK